MTAAAGSATATAIVQNPDEQHSSLIPYTFHATDDFGCTYDTTVTVNVLASRDPSCCVLPTPNVTAGNSAPCSNSTTLTVGGYSDDGNTGEWTYTTTSGGIATFTAPTSLTTSVSVNVYGEYTFTWHEYYQGNHSCAGEASVTVHFYRQMNAELPEIGNLCRGAAMVLLTAQDYGTFTCTPSTPAFSAEARTFTPSLAAPGQYTITNRITADMTIAACADPAVSTRTFSVNDELVVTLDDPICINGTEPTVTLNFHISGVSGATPPQYMIGYTYTQDDDDPGLSQTYNDTLRNQTGTTYSITAPSALDYSYTFIDNNRCSTVRIPGYFACACPNYSGAFADYSARIRCTGETVALGHDGLQEVDLEHGGVFSFVVCTNASDIVGSYVCTLPGTTTTVSPTNITGFQYNRQYYIVAVAGYASGIGAWSVNGCRSVSRPIPMMWKETPTPTATGAETCGRVITLDGSVPPSGMQGYWTASAEGIDNYSYTTINGTDNTMYNATVFSNYDGEVSFVWHVANAECVGESPAVIYNFRKVPTPEAGYDRTVCGLSAEILGANATQPPIEGSVLTWTGSGVIMNPPTGSAQPFANANEPGTYVITLTERNANCVGTDDVRITFVSIPAPTTTPNVDTVCGQTAELQVHNANPRNGHWSAYDMQGHGLTTVIYRPYNMNESNPGSADSLTHCFVTVPIPDDVTEVEYEFRWTETVSDPRIPAGEECTSTCSKHIVFRKVPVAHVYQCDDYGASTGNFTTICGRTVKLCADALASEGFANYMWTNKDINGRYTDSLSTETYFTLDSMYNITRFMDVPFYFIARNGNCMAIDTMTVRFLQRPEANAGLDIAVCGTNYTLNGVWSNPPSEDYTPQCSWNVLSKPNQYATVTWDNGGTSHNSITEPIGVSQTGIYTFTMREVNPFDASNCYDIDTVTVEFLVEPRADAGDDFNVCGLDFTMRATISQNPGDSIVGSWTCISGGQSTFVDRTDPTTEGHYSQYGSADFMWIETVHPHLDLEDPITCSDYDTVTITFYERPTARINMNAADTIACGVRFEFLRADSLRPNWQGRWYDATPNGTYFTYEDQTVTDVTVANIPSRHDFYWIAANVPPDSHGGSGTDFSFCSDTSDVWTVEFVEMPTVFFGTDIDHRIHSGVYCSHDAHLPVNGNGVGTGIWSTSVPANRLSFDDPTDPNTNIHAHILNSESQTYPYYRVFWNVQNTEFCTARDSFDIVFARVPSATIEVIPPKCFGEPAILTADEDSLGVYDWTYGDGQQDSVAYNGVQYQGYDYPGGFRTLVHWDNKEEFHVVGLTTTNAWGCVSNIETDTVWEPTLPEYHYNIIQDTCSLGKGGIEFLDTTGVFAFFWTDTTENSAHAVGPNPPTGAITGYHVYNIPAGTYTYRAEYNTENRNYQSVYQAYFGTYRCIDYPEVEVGTIGMIEAEFAVSADIVLADLVAPDAHVIFVNSTNYDNIGKKCEWHFGDGVIEKNCDELVEHIYAEPGCYEPYLIVMNRDLPECRDTAYLGLETVCGGSFIYVDKASSLEIPNIFSPNDDGINDYFQVHAQTLKKFNGKILNRYGRLVYEWTDWEAEDAGWDGRLNGTTKATPGVYYYIIEAEGYDGTTYNPSGPLHLVR